MLDPIIVEGGDWGVLGR